MIYWDLFFTFFKIGLFTFGGGYAMLPLIQSEVLRKGWLEASQIVNFIAISESTPGPFAINISTFVGMEKAGILGSLCATCGVVLPSFLIILIVARFYQSFRDNRIVSGVMSGLKPATVGLIGAAVLSVGRTVFFPAGSTVSSLGQPVFLVSLGIFALMAFLSLRKKLHPILIICLSAAIGIGAGYLFQLPV